jgi:2,4-dienoyl-CoA reductase (NADPH2)
MKFKKLFEPCKVGRVELKNRIIMPPMSTNYAEDGWVTERMRNYYVERAKGGASLIMVEDAIVDYPMGRHLMYPLRIDDDKCLPGLRSLAEAIKAAGAKAALQLGHAGRKAGKVAGNGYLALTRGQIPVAPSRIAHPATGYVVPRELTFDEIEELIDKFAEAARRVRDAGFDALSLHCAHMYLVNQFLSPASNQRTDEYGGDLDGRFRFLQRIIEKIKHRVGEDYPMLCRINGEEPLANGLKLEDNKKIARKLEEAGMDAISVSYGNSGIVLHTPDFVSSIAPMRIPRGCLVRFAEGIKQAVSLPVIAGGRINSPELAEQILEEGRADLISMGRALLADPGLPRKTAEGRTEDIRPCIACLQGCGRRLELDSELGITCTVNPAVGKEEELRITPADKRKKILIAGGGPAGMQAAIVAALRGHQVLVYEEGDELGGQMLVARIPPGKEEIANLIDYLRIQVKKLGVEIKLKTRVSPEIVRQIRPDVLILAIGARPFMPEIPGIDGENVVTAIEALKGDVQLKDKIAILGGGQVGTETAEFLAQKGKQVILIEMLAQVASDIPNTGRQLLLFSLEDLNVRVLTTTKAEQVTATGVTVSKLGQKQFIEADTILLALGAKPDTELAGTLRNQVPELYLIGDCMEPRKILDGIAEGTEIAREV